MRLLQLRNALAAAAGLLLLLTVTVVIAEDAAAGDDNQGGDDGMEDYGNSANSYQNGDDSIKYWTDYAIVPKRCIV